MTYRAFTSRQRGTWALNGITTFQNGFPLAFIDASNNAVVNNFAVGNAAPGTGAGITRPKFAAGCDPAINGLAQARLAALKARSW